MQGAQGRRKVALTTLQLGQSVAAFYIQPCVAEYRGKRRTTKRQHHCALP